MEFERARRLIHALRREAPAPRPGGPSTPTPDPAGGPGPRRTRVASICVASGKGGTGKSVVTASLAALLGRRGRTLLVDADMGVGNAHLLQDVSPARSFVDVAQGRCDVAAAITACGAGLDLVSAGSGVSSMAGLTPYEMHLIAGGLERLDTEYSYALVDSAAGISDQTVGFAAACDLVLVVTNPDVTAMTDAYAFLKVLFARRPDANPMLVVNRVPLEARAEDELVGRAAAEHVAGRIGQVCLKFLGREPRLLGAVPEDRCVAASIAARRPLVLSEPGAPAALALHAMLLPLLDELQRLPHPGLGRSLAHQAGFSTASA